MPSRNSCGCLAKPLFVLGARARPCAGAPRLPLPSKCRNCYIRALQRLLRVPCETFIRIRCAGAAGRGRTPTPTPLQMQETLHTAPPGTPAGALRSLRWNSCGCTVTACFLPYTSMYPYLMHPYLPHPSRRLLALTTSLPSRFLVQEPEHVCSLFIDLLLCLCIQAKTKKNMTRSQ